LLAKFYLPQGQNPNRRTELRNAINRIASSPDGNCHPQNFLFTGTVSTTSASPIRQFPGIKLVAVADRLGCRKEIEEIGLDTVIFEDGLGISAGQRQLVGIARAMLVDPKILILDEATSAVDSLTETKIQRALQVLFRGRTSFVIAHRLSTVRNADGVLVLDRGRIVE
jgi:ATP-binding cassette, subfamily B, bacterial